MRRDMIDGDRWIRERLTFLRGLRESDLTDEQRTAVEIEIASLSEERGIHHGGPHLFRGWSRRWFRRWQARAPHRGK